MWLKKLDAKMPFYKYYHAPRQEVLTILIQRTVRGTISRIMCILVREVNRLVKQNTHLETSFLTPFFTLLIPSFV